MAYRSLSGSIIPAATNLFLVGTLWRGESHSGAATVVLLVLLLVLLQLLLPLVLHRLLSVVDTEEKTVVHNIILCQELHVRCQSLQQLPLRLLPNFDLGPIIEEVHVFQSGLLLLLLLV